MADPTCGGVPPNDGAWGRIGNPLWLYPYIGLPYRPYRGYRPIKAKGGTFKWLYLA